MVTAKLSNLRTLGSVNLQACFVLRRRLDVFPPGKEQSPARLSFFWYRLVATLGCALSAGGYAVFSEQEFSLAWPLPKRRTISLAFWSTGRSGSVREKSRRPRFFRLVPTAHWLC